MSLQEMCRLDCIVTVLQIAGNASNSFNYHFWDMAAICNVIDYKYIGIKIIPNKNYKKINLKGGKYAELGGKIEKNLFSFNICWVM